MAKKGSKAVKWFEIEMRTFKGKKWNYVAFRLKDNEVLVFRETTAKGAVRDCGVKLPQNAHTRDFVEALWSQTKD